jgi:hypothetical protein
VSKVKCEEGVPWERSSRRPIGRICCCAGDVQPTTHERRVHAWTVSVPCAFHFIEVNCIVPLPFCVCAFGGVFKLKVRTLSCTYCSQLSPPPPFHDASSWHFCNHPVHQAPRKQPLKHC